MFIGGDPEVVDDCSTVLVAKKQVLKLGMEKRQKSFEKEIKRKLDAMDK